MDISSQRRRDFLWYWLPPLAWCGTVLFFSGDLGSSKHTLGLLEWLLSWFPPLSSEQFYLVHFYFRKTLGHFANYAFLYVLWFRAFRCQLGCGPVRTFFLPMALCLTVALLDEAHQSWFTSRTSSPWDVALDMSGVLTAALGTWIFWSPSKPAASR